MLQMKFTTNKSMGRKKKDGVITIVSGLPRSGTSMMMQMLEAGGMAVVTDNIRKPDEDNPHGYYEFEKVKRIKEDVSWLEDCYGKAFKMVSGLLYHLPAGIKYKVIFLKREMEEVLASQTVMLERLGRNGSDVSNEDMAEKYSKHLRNMEIWLGKRGDIDVLYVKYNDVIAYPHEKAMVLNSYLGGFLNVEKMASVVKKSLYRQRKNLNDSRLC